MPYQRLKYGIFLLIMVLLALGGCAREIQRPMQICPGKESAIEALSALKARTAQAVPIRAYGRCRLRYHDTKGKTRKRQFPVKLWLNPPAEAYMQGDVAFDPRGIMLGSNAEEFWLAIRLKEVSSYWWGRRSNANYAEGLMISPEAVLESLGVASIVAGDKDEDNWSLVREGVFDVLTQYSDDGLVVQKLYIYCCDYLVRKIEFFDIYGKVTIVAEMDKYEQVTEGFYMPTEANIIRFESEDVQDSLKVTLRSIRITDFTEKQHNRLFTRPEPKGFQHIYKISGGDIVEIVQ